MKKFVFTASLMTFGVALFMTSSSSGDVALIDEALAGSTCCPQATSICITGAGDITDYYGKWSGPCPLSGGGIE